MALKLPQMNPPSPINTPAKDESPPLYKPGNHLSLYLCSLSSVILQTPVIYSAVNSTLATRQFLICHAFCLIHSRQRRSCSQRLPLDNEESDSSLAHNVLLAKRVEDTAEPSCDLLALRDFLLQTPV